MKTGVGVGSKSDAPVVQSIDAQSGQEPSVDLDLTFADLLETDV